MKTRTDLSDLVRETASHVLGDMTSRLLRVSELAARASTHWCVKAAAPLFREAHWSEIWREPGLQCSRPELVLNWFLLRPDLPPTFLMEVFLATKQHRYSSDLRDTRTLLLLSPRADESLFRLGVNLTEREISVLLAVPRVLSCGEDVDVVRSGFERVHGERVVDMLLHPLLPRWFYELVARYIRVDSSGDGNSVSRICTELANHPFSPRDILWELATSSVGRSDPAPLWKVFAHSLDPETVAENFYTLGPVGGEAARVILQSSPGTVIIHPAIERAFSRALAGLIRIAGTEDLPSDVDTVGKDGLYQWMRYTANAEVAVQVFESIASRGVGFQRAVSEAIARNWSLPLELRVKAALVAHQIRCVAETAPSMRLVELPGNIISR